nr:MAG: major capsid protein [Microviridae sp.]
MAQNIWDATLDVDNNVKQNSFDWNHTNNLTTQIGRLTPVFCDLVPAKTSFRVKPSFGLQFMPMVFPIQTRMRASISFFRYPLRALWKDYKDFVGNFRQGLEEPYLNLNTEERLQKMASTGSIGDYLGLPTTIVGKFGTSTKFTLPVFHNAQPSSVFSGLNVLPADVQNYLMQNTPDLSAMYGTTSVSSGNWVFSYVTGFEYTKKPDVIVMRFSVTSTSSTSIDKLASDPIFIFDVNSMYGGSVYSSNKNVVSKVINGRTIQYTLTIRDKDVLAGFDLTSITGLGILLPNLLNNNGWFSEANSPLFTLSDVTVSDVEPSSPTDLTLATSPYYSSISSNKDNQVKLAAYSFRAYEGIYNAFYRDNRNNPYYINGDVQYNQWIPSYEGGEDNNLYELRYANWERDFLTTAVQSPQQGQAPLVGITTYTTTGVMTNSDGTSSEVPVQKVALVDESGKRYSVEFQSNDEGLTGVNYVELENGVTVRSARNLLDLATSGISIPDLRMVNCYQKFLELNMRKGYSYKEIVEGRFDVNVKYADLLLPQFFGGFSRDMNMNAITQTVDQDSTGSGSYREALGSQAGVGYFSGNTDHNIECFCDEESIIMGILVVTPLPVYTQLLPKHFTYRGLLDHFNPEFNNIGFQPISYKEVCPIQAYNDNPASLNGTFGYQRPWYEYCQRYDQAHGLFRTSLSNFLMHRVFDVKPELAQSFLVIDPEQVTDVFSVTETTDKIYGQIRFDITCQLPVARVAIPRLD